MMFRNHLGMFLVAFVAFSLEKGLSLDLRGPGITTSQSSTSHPGFEASRAVDQNISTNTQTEQQTNPWWKVDLGAVYCLRKITLVKLWHYEYVVVHAGLNMEHLLNPAVGQPSAYTVYGGAVDFLLDPYVTARYVSVDIPTNGTVNGTDTMLSIAEVVIEEVTMDTIKIDTPSSDQALTLTGLPSSQSSTFGDWSASRAVDGSLMYGYGSGHISHTNWQQDPWWKIDLTSVHCIGKIAVRSINNTIDYRRLWLGDAVVRAGLNATHPHNPNCSSPVTFYQALINDWIEFACPPYTLARYVSVDIPRETYLVLAEVMVWPCDLHPTATNLADKPSNQSSTEGTSTADRAIDSLPTEPYCSLTRTEINPWWMVDLESSQCLGQIRVWSSSRGTSIQDVVVRAGPSSNHTDNIACGQQVQASSDFVEFTCDPPVLARYVSVDIPGMAQLGLCEVTVATCDFTEKVDGGDLAVVVNPSLLGAAGDNDSVITVYRGPEEIASKVSFGRQVSTGGSSGLPSGSGEIVDPSLGCSVRLLRLPEQGGLDRTGVLYAETTRNGLTTRIQTVILPKDGAHIRPVMRTQTASIGDSVVMEMLKVNPPSEAYRWRRDEGDIIEAWNDLLKVSVSDVAKEDEGVYSCFILAQEDEQLHGIMRLIVRDCPSGRWDPPSCLKTCRRCYNGGVCDDQSGICVCAPGFSGDSCEQVHGRAVFGKTAEQRCSNNTDPHNDACRGRLFCLPDPYGCSCAAGYMGLDCMQECDEGRFGADCKQTCHCASGSTCSKDTGECSNDCEASYFERNCQCSTQNGVLGLEVTSGDPHQLFVAWQPDPCSSGYEVTTRDDCGDIVSQESIPETTYHFITGLESTQKYSVSVRPLYPGDVKGPEATFQQTSSECENETYQGLTWPVTSGGSTAKSVERCPLKTMNAGEPRAVRNCSAADPPVCFQWEEPHSHSCGENRNEVTLEDVEDVEVSTGNAIEVAEFLANQTSGSSEDAEDLEVVSNILVNIVNAGSGDTEVTELVLETVSNVIMSVKDTPDFQAPNINTENSSAIIQAVESQVSLTLRQEGNVSIRQDTVHVEAIALDPVQARNGLSIVSIRQAGQGLPKEGSRVGTQVQVIVGSGVMPKESDVLALVRLPGNIVDRIWSADNNSHAKLLASFLIYAGDTLFQSASIKEYRGKDNSTRKVAGSVISLTVENAELVSLTEAIEIQFKMPDNATADNATCVSWDFELEDGIGDWSTAGCELAQLSNEQVSCNCYHATNFAILVDVKGQLAPDDSPAEQVLGYISQIGCTLSSIALAITLVIYLANRKLRSSKSRQIFIHFCFSLFMLNIVFLAGIDNAKATPGGCVFVAALLHYLTLSTMMWMAVEARNLYVCMVKVFPENTSRYMLKACLIAWGSPLIVLTISLPAASHHYDHKYYCFPEPGLVLFLGLIAPIGLILIHNIITFILVMRSLVMKVREASRSQQISKRLQNAVGISALMGLTWIFGFLAIGEATFAFRLISCLANSLQGLVIFIMFCIRPEEVRSALIPCFSRCVPNTRSTKSNDTGFNLGSIPPTK